LGGLQRGAAKKGGFVGRGGNDPPGRFVPVIGLNDDSSDFQPMGMLLEISKRQETGHLWQ